MSAQLVTTATGQPSAAFVPAVPPGPWGAQPVSCRKYLPHPILPPSPEGKQCEGFKNSPAEKSHFHVPPGQHLADAPHFGQVAFDVQNLLFCRNGVQFCIPVGVWRWGVEMGQDLL